MAEYTQNYNLKKPAEEDFYNVKDFNDNADIIDQALKAHDDALATKETPQGAQEKADAALNSAKQYTDQEVGEVAQELAAHKADNVAHGTATQAEAQAGTSNTKYMTPLRTKEAIQALESVSSVAGKKGAVTLTKSDVGLSNVLNYGVATQAEAQAGTSNTKYMTPLRTKEAIQALATNGIIKSVQRGRAELRDGDTVINITISPVNTSKTMVNLVSSHSGSSHTEVALELTSATNLRATKHGIDYTLGVAWEVIEFY